MSNHHAQVLAIDPGLEGAWATLDFGGGFQRAEEIPRFAKSLNGVAFANIIKEINPLQIVIEEVGAMPKQGVTSVFTFAKCYGICVGIACGADMPIHFVRPHVWKAHFRLNGRPKDAARERAIQLFPSAASSLTLKKHHGRADAILLARYFLDQTERI